MVIYGRSDDGDCNDVCRDACKDAGGGGDEYGDEISYDMLAPHATPAETPCHRPEDPHPGRSTPGSWVSSVFGNFYKRPPWQI